MKLSPRLGAFSGACLAWLLASVGAAQEKDTSPKFDSTSSEAVLLRHKLKNGQVLKFDMDMDMDIAVRMGAEQLTMTQAMRMEGKMAVTGVDDEGNMSAVAKITRMTMKMTGPAAVEFDTDKASEDPNFKPLMAMINVGIPCKMSPLGKMLETDLEPMRLAMRRAGNAALSKVLEDSTKKMFDGTFVQFPEKAIKAGETYKAGTIVEDKMKIQMSYRVKSVSGDKSQAVLEPVPVLEMADGAFPGMDAKLQKQQIAGWLLFDIQKGYVVNGELRMQMDLDISAMGQKGTAALTGKTVVTQTLK